MDEIFNFKIKNLGPVDNVDIDLGKINIIGGHNSTGKSTVSKALYCFLKANCDKRQEFALESLASSIKLTINHLYGNIRYSRKLKNIDLIDLIDEYEKSKEFYFKNNDYYGRGLLPGEIEDLDNAIKEIENNGNSLYLSLMRNLLQIEFLTDEFNSYMSIKNYSEEHSFEFIANFSEYYLDIDNAFKSRGLIDVYDIFYIDSFSIFDLDRTLPSFKIRKNANYNHVDYLRLILKDNFDESKELFDDKKNKKIICVENKIKDIIGGKIEFNQGKFNFILKNSEPCDMHNTASGIKQIGVIQLLLSSRRLKENSFLIIDEPEVNLHPDWQFKLAEILVLLVKDLNISIYINTHSPMFIEAIEVFTKFYDLEDDTFYYLTQHSSDSNRYCFKYIDNDNLYELYDNLSEPYTNIERFRIKSKYK